MPSSCWSPAKSGKGAARHPSYVAPQHNSLNVAAIFVGHSCHTHHSMLLMQHQLLTDCMPLPHPGSTQPQLCWRGSGLPARAGGADRGEQHAHHTKTQGGAEATPQHIPTVYTGCRRRMKRWRPAVTTCSPSTSRPGQHRCPAQPQPKGPCSSTMRQASSPLTPQSPTARCNTASPLGLLQGGSDLHQGPCLQQCQAAAPHASAGNLL